jgi:hypothetical protein
MSRHNELIDVSTAILEFVQDPDNKPLSPEYQEQYNRMKAIENWRNQGFTWPQINKLFRDEFNVSLPRANWYINLFLEVCEKDIMLAPKFLLGEVLNLCDKIIFDNKASDPKVAIVAGKLKLEAINMIMKSQSDKDKKKGGNVTKVTIVISNKHGKATEIEAEDIPYLPVEERNKILEQQHATALPLDIPGEDNAGK